MKAKLFDLWKTVRNSLWFVPSLMAGSAIIFALGMIRLDEVYLVGYSGLRNVLYAGDSQGARLLLSSIAGSMITVAGVTFSITMVALTLTISQFGPRLLSNFMADRVNQIVLGTFIGTFIYCLLVLGTIRESGNEAFVPRLAISISILLVLTNFGILIYFFHHVSTSIHAENVIESVYRQLKKTIEKFFSEDHEGVSVVEGEIRAEWLDFENKGGRIMAPQSGYLRILDEGTLLDFALKHDIVIKIVCRPGYYVFVHTPMVLFLPNKHIEPEKEESLFNAFVLGSSRSLEQDVEYSIFQLVEVAVRALSPGINDPHTAMHCIDRLGAAFCHMNEKNLPTPYRYDDDGRMRLLLEVVTFDGILDAAFNQIRQYGRGNVDINIRLLETLQVIAMTTEDQVRHAAVRRHGEMVYRSCRQTIPEKDDLGDIDGRYQRLMEQLQG